MCLQLKIVLKTYVILDVVDLPGLKPLCSSPVIFSININCNVKPQLITTACA